jgi:phospholipid-transporting ATPase
VIAAFASDYVYSPLLFGPTLFRRVSPDQKREMVNMIKMGVPGVRTLSIGDGANDVAMIQEAHIGVGIRGEEGLQAVNASDYAIAQFRYLQVLMLKHGRNNYTRMSNLVCYMFYKNILMSSSNFWFAWLNGFSGITFLLLKFFRLTQKLGTKMFTEGAIQFYNLFYTAVPIVLYGVYDTDIPSSILYKFPQLYQPGINGEKFNVR